MGIIYRKKKITLNYKEEKPEVYKIAKIVMPKVSYDELLKDVAHAEGVNDTAALAVVRGLLNRMEVFLGLGHSVSLGEFGTFSPNLRVCVTQTIDDANANTIKKKHIRFIPGARLRDVIKNMSVNEADGLSVKE
ncbi:MAG: hypothetical protein KBT29_04620 [Prevotellaceae bacterium]|nr:hypothetical protein [Candidatus Minthosoma caballi]